MKSPRQLFFRHHKCIIGDPIHIEQDESSPSVLNFLYSKLTGTVHIIILNIRHILLPISKTIEVARIKNNSNYINDYFAVHAHILWTDYVSSTLLYECYRVEADQRCSPGADHITMLSRTHNMSQTVYDMMAEKAEQQIPLLPAIGKQHEIPEHVIGLYYNFNKSLYTFKKNWNTVTKNDDWNDFSSAY